MVIKKGARFIIESADFRRVTSYDYKIFVQACADQERDGWKLKKVKRRIQWPFFWIVKYKAIFIKPYILETTEEHFAYINIESKPDGNWEKA